MTSIRAVVVGTAVLLIGWAAPNRAAASPVVLDFSNSSIYGIANGKTSVTIVDQGETLTLTSSGGTLTQTSDGFGVDGPTSLDDPGEIGIFELFGSGINPPAFVYSVDLTQLYSNDLGFYVEKGEYSVNFGAYQSFSATSTSGNLTLTLNAPNVTSLRFKAPGLLDDYSVKSLTIEDPPPAVPEPASLVLLGTGLVGFVRRRRRLLK